MIKLTIAAGLLAASIVITGLSQFSIPNLNKQASASPDLADWKGLKCTVHLRVDVNPRAGINGSFDCGTSAAGVKEMAGMPMAAVGVVAAVTRDCVVINGGNGYVWIPRDQIRCVEALQDAPSK
jgi:hypothetical protein